MDPRIDELQRRGAAKPGVLALGGGLPAPELFPRAELAAAFLNVIAEPEGSALQYGWPEGREGLRKFIADRLCARGADVSPEAVVVTSGAQQAIDIAVQAVFASGDRIGCDPETYPGALDLFRDRGLEPTSSYGEVAGYYLLPSITNPHGRRMNGDDRAKIVEPARARRIPIIEDDAYADLDFGGDPGRPLLADAPEVVWHVGTFSKTLCPGLRVGWLVAPRAFRESVLTKKHGLDLQANSLAQSILEAFLGRDDFDRHVARARKFYERRASRLASALRRHLPSWRFEAPRGGLAIWAETEEEGDDTELLAAAIEHGVSFDPGRSFRVSGQVSPLSLRLSFANEGGETIDEGVRRLARAFHAFAGRGRAAA